MKKILPICLALCAILLVLITGCSALEQSRIAKSQGEKIGLDLSSGSPLPVYDSHGGFQNDGIRCLRYQFEDDALENQLVSAPFWKSLPLDKVSFILAYGLDTGDNCAGPYLVDSDNKPLLPPVENGSYFFLNRFPPAQEDGLDLHDPEAAFEHGIFNFTLAVYDQDARILYILDMDI